MNTPDSPSVVVGASSDGDERISAGMVWGPHLCGDACQCFCGGAASDCVDCYGDSTSARVARQGSAFTPEDPDGLEHPIAETLWALNRTLRPGTQGPNDNQGSDLCKDYGYARVKRQVDWLRLRVDFASKRIEKPFGLLTEMVKRNEPPPSVALLNRERISEYADAILRGPDRGIAESELPRYALKAVHSELARRKREQQARDPEAEIAF